MSPAPAPRPTHFRNALPQPEATRLTGILAGAQANAPLALRCSALVRLIFWLRDGSHLEAPRDKVEQEHPPVQRLRLLLDWMETDAHLRLRVSQWLASVWRDASCLRLFGDVGLPKEDAFLGEAVEHILRKCLPRSPDFSDLTFCFARMFRSASDAAWIGALAPDDLTRIRALGDGGLLPAPLHEARAQAMRLLAAHISAIGSTEDMRLRMPEVALADSPFLRLPFEVARLCGNGGPTPLSPVGTERRGAESLIHCIVECRFALGLVLKHLEDSGVSVRLVFRIEKANMLLDRLERLVDTANAHASAAARALSWQRLCCDLVLGRLRDDSLQALLHSNTRQLTRKISERAGVTGRHYITRTREEWKRMLGGAAGGGFLTVGTIALKTAVGAAKLPLFFDFAFQALNYSASFLTMQVLHFKLATKQPAMTAAALADKLRTREDRTRPDRFVDEIACITRSQFAAALGNIGTVIPTAVAFHFAWIVLRGHSFYDPAKARHVVESFHPFTSLALPHAALTGLLLWMASVCAGWIANWFVYRKISVSVAGSPMWHMMFGRKNCERIARGIGRHAGDVGGNVSLGILLAATPVCGAFFGLPLGVAHVTLSAGSLALAGAELGWKVLLEPAFLAAGACIVGIGLLNFGVSFALALLVALRARDVDQSGLGRLFRAVARELRRRPLDFFLPPKDGTASRYPHQERRDEAPPSPASRLPDGAE